MDHRYSERGFLPAIDPLTEFPHGSPYAPLDAVGRDLPSLLHDPGFRDYARGLTLPPWQGGPATPDNLRELRLYYVRVGFLASAYVNQVGQEFAKVLPANIARPLADVCRRLDRPPILSYDGYALYNWKRFQPEQPIALGNIDTFQNFVHLYDERWFILVHVEIEALAAEVLAAVERISAAPADPAVVNPALARIAASVSRQAQVLRRIPEKMDPAIYFKAFRPYIRFFEKVVYEGVEAEPQSQRGETGAQSSIVPALVALMKIPHQSNVLMEHLFDMRRFMPADHRRYLEEVQKLPDLRPVAEREPFNAVLDAMADFRSVHFGWAEEYIHTRVADPRGTGGTPFRQWLGQLVDETRAHKMA